VRKVEPENPLEKIAREFKDLYEEFDIALQENEFDKAVRTGIDIMESLLDAVDRYVLPYITSPKVREIAVNIIGHHEKALAYAKGTLEAAQDIPPLYSQTAKEKAANMLSTGISTLFGFILGALIILSGTDPLLDVNEEIERAAGTSNEVPRFI